MTNLIRKSLGVGVVLLLASGSIFANTNNAISKGVYVQGDVGYGEVNAELENFSNDKDGVMGDLNLGYKFNQNFALEVGFAKFSDTTADVWYLDDQDVTKDNYYFDVAAKGIVPLGDRFDIFGKAGLAVVHTEWADYTSESGSYTEPALYLGAGIDFFVTQNLAFTLQATTTSKSGDDVPAMSAGTIGITYLFGNPT